VTTEDRYLAAALFQAALDIPHKVDPKHHEEPSWQKAMLRILRFLHARPTLSANAQAEQYVAAQLAFRYSSGYSFSFPPLPVAALVSFGFPRSSHQAINVQGAAKNTLAASPHKSTSDAPRRNEAKTCFFIS
jgi:hypothetical protein